MRKLGYTSPMGAKAYRFGVYTVDLARREIHCGPSRLDLPAKVFDCVTYLIEHRDRAVGRDELISAVWGRVDVADNLLAQIVLRARRAFDDGADTQQFIRTITGFGYRWVYEMDTDETAVNAVAASLSIPTPVPPSATPPPATPEPASIDPVGTEIEARVPPPLDLPMPRPNRAWSMLVVIFVALGLVKFGTYFFSTSRSPASQSTPATKDLAFVLPAVVHDAPDFAWARFGVMDLVAQRLREAGQATVASDTVVAVAKSVSAVPAATELDELAKTTGAHTFYQPDVLRKDDRWHVSVRVLSGANTSTTYDDSAVDLVQAANGAIAKLTSALGLSPLPYNEGYGPGATLAQQVTSAILQDRIGDARALIEAAPAEVRNDPRVRLQAASVDFYQSRVPEARAALDKLDAEASAERPPEFNARVKTGLATVAEREGRFADSERLASMAIESLERLDPAKVGNVLGPALTVRAAARLAQGAYDKAEDDFATARAVLTTTGNLRALALVDSNDSLMQMNRDRLRDALPGFNKSADYFRRTGAPIRELLNRALLVRCQLLLQDFEAASAEDPALAGLVDKVEDPEGRDEGRSVRAQIAFALGHMRDAQALADATLVNAELSDEVRGPVLLLDSKIAQQHGDFAHVAASATSALALKWADTQPRDYATAWLMLARADREIAADKSADDSARARAWASSSIHPSALLLVDLIEAEQMAMRGQDTPARTAFERALRATAQNEVPADIVEVTTSYATWLVGKGDFERAVAVLGRNHDWSATNFRVAVAEARLYRATGNEKLWRAALDRAQQTAGERTIPAEVSQFTPARTAATAPVVPGLAAP